MTISITVLGILCVIQIEKRRKLEKKIQEIADELSQFMIYRKVTQEETLEEGALSNLWNEIVQIEQMFCYQQSRNEAETMRLNQFIENMAHQMKTSLTALQIRLDSAQMAATTEQEIYALSRSQDCMERMTGEIERLLKSSQLAAGKVEMHLQLVKVQSLIHKCVRALEPLADRLQVAVHVEVPSALEVHMDEFWMEQALENIVKNALEHTKQNGSVRIEVRKNGNQIELLVEDEGRGIEVAELPYLFERFHRGSSTKAGYGIGLSMAADIVRAHHGEISAGNGKKAGMWFLIKLPILNGAQAYDIVRKDESEL